MLVKGQRLLLPVNPWFIIGSLVVALMLDLIPLGHLPWMPDLLLLTLLFWCLHQPAYVGVGSMFLAGLVMDVHHTTLLGIHALGYSLGAGIVLMARNRMLWFSAAMQAPQVLGALLVVHGVIWTLRLISNGQWPGWQLLLGPLIEAALWPLLSLLLLAPQRRAPDRDLTRPL